MFLNRYRPIFIHEDSELWKSSLRRYEAVLSPRYLDNVMKYIYEIKDKIMKNKFESLSAFCFIMNNYFSKYAVRFVPGSQRKSAPLEYAAGILGSGCLTNRKGTIKIYVHEDFLRLQYDEKFFKFFVRNVLRVIGHELIHRQEGLRIQNQKIRDYALDHSKLETKEYLANKQEMMARAWQIIEELRYKGYVDNAIRADINSKVVLAKSTSLSEYYDYFDYKTDKEIFKRLYKYIYMYLDGQEVIR